jgi:hypothetical protein
VSVTVDGIEYVIVLELKVTVICAPLAARTAPVAPGAMVPMAIVVPLADTLVVAVTEAVIVTLVCAAVIAGMSSTAARASAVEDSRRFEVRGSMFGSLWERL